MERPIHVLVVKIGAIGDAVMAVPMVSAVAKRGKTVVVAGRGAAQVFRLATPGVEVLDIDDAGLLRGSWFLRLRIIVKLWRCTGFRIWDEIYILHRDLRYRILTLFAIAKRTRVLAPLEKWQSNIVGRHMSQDAVSLVKEFPFTRGIYVELAKCLPVSTIAQSLNLKRYICLSPGGARNTLRTDDLKRWPLEHYRRVAEWSLNNGFGVLLIGSESDGWARHAFENLEVVDLIGKTSLSDVVSICGRTFVTITHDSGPMHLAALGGGRVIAVFGPTSEQQFGWRGSNFKVVVADKRPACSPCYNGREFQKCEQNICMSSVKPDAVISVIKDLK